MKIKNAIVGALALGLVAPAAVQAEGLELSGNITTFFGFQLDNNKNFWENTGNANFSGGIGGIPERGANEANRKTFNFYLDEVELSLQKDWGDNIRLRADIDFGAAGLGSNFSDDGGTAGIVVEQAYVTFGIGSAEIAVGRFNAPMGVYSVDRIDNVTISYHETYGFLPANVTGVKAYIPFGDSVDLSVAVINDFADNVEGVAGIDNFDNIRLPSALLRLGFNWGEEERQSTVGISGAVGQQFRAAGETEKPLSFIVDVDLNWWIADNFLLQAEALYRRDNSGTDNIDAATVISAFVLIDWLVSDEFDIYASYGFTSDATGTVPDSITTADTTRFDGQTHTGIIGFGYNIADGAKFRMEYRVDLGIVDNDDADLIDNGIAHSVLGSFSYAF